MKLLDRYIAKAVLSAIGLVTLMLAGLQIFILLVNQLDDLGRGDFGLLQAAFFVLLQMPYQVYLFFPLACLLGSLVGLGILANHRELIVMRAAGVSIARITLAVLKAALIVIVVATLTGETVVPYMAHIANDQKMQTLSGGQALRTARGVWLRHKNDFITAGAILADDSLENVFQFRFDDQHTMRMARHIAHLVYDNNQWQATDIEETLITDNGTQTRKIDTMLWDVNVKPAILGASTNDPDEMSLYQLRQYVRAQKKSHQSALSYQIAYWQRLFQPVTTVVMMLLAIPFIFGPLRSSTMGSKLLAGATVGFGFHIINRFFGPLSQVMQWSPIWAAIAPAFLFAILGVFLMRRMR